MYKKNKTNFISNFNSAIPTMTDQEFKSFSELIYKNSGIKMPQTKKQMLTGRLAKRLRFFNIRSFGDYYDYVCSQEGGEAELQVLINNVTTNKTDFFREPKHFDVLIDVVFPDLLEKGLREGKKNITIWSAGCSTGEEPYTLAMIANEFFEKYAGWRFTILATDLSTRVLEHAALGIYDHSRVEPMPMTFRKKYLLRSKKTSEKKVRVHPTIREKVCFKQLNFMDRKFSVIPDGLEIIFCRNVLIYFDKKTQEEVIRRLCNHLVPMGYLFLGHSETIQGYKLPLTTLESTVYRKTRSISSQGVGFFQSGKKQALDREEYNGHQQ